MFKMGVSVVDGGVGAVDRVAGHAIANANVVRRLGDVHSLD